MDANQNLKQEVKFRVTSKVAGQKPWSEKWAVKMGEGEEFIVTDEILKYPTHLITGKTVCTFSMLDSKLNFEYRESEKPCLVSGNPYTGGPSEHIPVSEGDGIEIGEGIKIEIVKAPLLPKQNAQENDGPSVLSLVQPSALAPKSETESPIDIHVPEPTAAAIVNEANEESIVTENDHEADSRLMASEEIVTEEKHPEHSHPESHSEEENHEESNREEVHAHAQFHSSSKGTKEKFDFQKFILPVKNWSSQISKDKATRVAGIGALALMSGVLLWKVVNTNGGKMSKGEPKPERNLAELPLSGERIEIEPLQPGISLREIDSRINQMNALGARIGGRVSPQHSERQAPMTQTTSLKSRSSHPSSTPKKKR